MWACLIGHLVKPANSLFERGIEMENGRSLNFRLAAAPAPFGSRGGSKTDGELRVACRSKKTYLPIVAEFSSVTGEFRG
jgi:hypothetical protein